MDEMTWTEEDQKTYAYARSAYAFLGTGLDDRQLAFEIIKTYDLENPINRKVHDTLLKHADCFPSKDELLNNLADATEVLLLYVTSGKRYTSINPYSVVEVKEAILALRAIGRDTIAPDLYKENK
jgi:hypothetical protein